MISTGQCSSYLVLLVRCHDQIVERYNLILFVTKKDISDVLIRPKYAIDEDPTESKSDFSTKPTHLNLFPKYEAMSCYMKQMKI